MSDSTEGATLGALKMDERFFDWLPDPDDVMEKVRSRVLGVLGEADKIEAVSEVTRLRRPDPKPKSEPFIPPVDAVDAAENEREETMLRVDAGLPLFARSDPSRDRRGQSTLESESSSISSALPTLWRSRSVAFDEDESRLSWLEVDGEVGSASLSSSDATENGEEAASLCARFADSYAAC